MRQGFTHIGNADGADFALVLREDQVGTQLLNTRGIDFINGERLVQQGLDLTVYFHAGCGGIEARSTCKPGGIVSPGESRIRGSVRPGWPAQPKAQTISVQLGSNETILLLIQKHSRQLPAPKSQTGLAAGFC